MSDTKMTVEEREDFLTKPWVAVISIPEQNRGPLAVPVWYLYEPGGDFCIWTGPKTRKGILLRSAERISVCIQDQSPPYKYVSVEGPVRIEPMDFERYVRSMAYRYFNPEQAERYLVEIGGAAGVAKDILVRIKPERWLTVDYSKLEQSQD
jgi:nitroimidazol reductase NimA-like FMN-containing flavoprotein (pyridoxamine 5'-phosphate oxidase superfamily)